MLERAARDLGVDVRIYLQDPTGVPASLDGTLPEDIAEGMARATIESGTVMDHGGWAWSGWFDLVSVHQVLEAVVGRILGAATPVAVAPQGRDGSEDKETVNFPHIKGIYRVWKVEQLHQLVLRPKIQASMSKLKLVPPQMRPGQLKRSDFPWIMGANQTTYKDWHPHRAPARDHLNELPCGAAPDGHRRLDSHQSQFPLNADVERAGHARKKAIGRASDVPAVRGALETAREEARKSGRHGVRLILRLGLGDGGRHNLWEYGRCSGCSLRRQDRLMRKRQLIRAEEEVVVLQDGEGGRFRPLGTLRAPMPKHGHICKFVADCGYYRILD
ncbi:hypothetical protein PgNI_05176 [Pyricularia grisea]|uniref:Uncharacterized protein n=1 Tax=Pyricularia grisea TaxID=148305 RepID=A0A6P8B7R6_PYRGI|nr:hypothetical protein PgNI_05176 [Pyricularia grisea]TLD11288.1 hypothetical protein PgNI_05176 [Pyricularia grisea]